MFIMPSILVLFLSLRKVKRRVHHWKFTVIGPQQPIIALVGGETIFPCYLSPQINAQDMDVMWFYGESSQVVHRYKYRQDYLNHQHQDYKGRTEFLRHDISTGSVALKICHIRPSDEGKYRCYFESSSAYGEAEYQVFVAGEFVPDILGHVWV
uniref:Ig-like domain-containing protein n=1 Tax=Sarcophilus harrisii TaxID=9305 RepID=G3VAI7_SARHA